MKGIQFALFTCNTVVMAALSLSKSYGFYMDVPFNMVGEDALVKCRVLDLNLVCFLERCLFFHHRCSGTSLNFVYVGVLLMMGLDVLDNGSPLAVPYPGILVQVKAPPSC